MVEEKKKEPSKTKDETERVYLAEKAITADLPYTNRPTTPQPKKKQE